MAIEEIKMPQLGESVTEGTLNTWLVKVGDYVNKYDPLADIMTDKVNAEVPSTFSGTITKLVIAEGETISVGEIICHIETNDNEIRHNNSEAKDPEPKKIQIENKDQSMKKRYSPAVLNLAQENDIDLSSLEGSGLGGRITRKDVEKAIISKPKPENEVIKPDHNPLPVREQPSFEIEGDTKTISVHGVRKVIAKNMVKSASEIPHGWMMVEVDVSDLVKYRNKIKASFKEREGFNITYFAFFVKAVAQALKEFPLLNSTWAGEQIILHDSVNVSIAVAKGNELFVPVIKNASEKSVMRIAKDIHELAIKARVGQLTLDDMTGGTFTVNNTGSFGSVQSMGIINHPQAAILQVESIVKRPVIMNDNMFAARDIVNLCLSIDHRILDGLVAGNFMAKLKQSLESMRDDTIQIY